MSLKNIHTINFEFIYLAQLTLNGLKPLSRWETELNLKDLSLLRSIGLEYTFVTRRLLNGSIARETIFSTKPQVLETYYSRFNDSILDKSAESKRIEGELFGYPACCIDHFIQHPYSSNNLTAEEQKLLFYWACPFCNVTPLLIPRYRSVHEYCLQLYKNSFAQQKVIHRKWEKMISAAASISLLLLNSPQCTRDLIFPSQPFIPDAHMISLLVDVDPDQDYLENRYEKILQLDGNKSDTDADGMMDGPDLALHLWGIYKTLPSQPRQEDPYVENHMMRGLETCNICNQTINMGYAVLINPLENLSMEVPYIFLHHFFDHGSFSYDGSLHGAGRINSALLSIILTSNGHSHWLGAHYTDQEVQESRSIATQIDSLPRETLANRTFAIDFMMRGIEMCHSCGENINMGYLKIQNPTKNMSFDLPYIAFHFLHCGGKKYEGDIHVGEIDVALLKDVLK